MQSSTWFSISVYCFYIWFSWVRRRRRSYQYECKTIDSDIAKIVVNHDFIKPDEYYVSKRLRAKGRRNGFPGIPVLGGYQIIFYLGFS